MTDTGATFDKMAQWLSATNLPNKDLPDGSVGIVVPAGYKIEKFQRVDPPMQSFTTARPMLHDQQSFIAYVNQFKEGSTSIFAEPGFLRSGQACVQAVIDYHDDAAPNRCAHVATFQPRYSDAWTRWNNAAKAPMTQAAFAEFVEECRNDIVEPEAARLLDIVRTFKASKKVEFDSVTYQPNGDVKLVYEDRTEQKQATSGALPETMKLGIPVYFRGDAYKVPVFVRYRVGDGAVKFQIKIDRADVIEDEAFKMLMAAIEKETQIAPYLGRVG